MFINREGLTKLNDIFSTRQKVEIMEIFEEHGELCFSMLVKKGKDANKQFVNNSSLMGLINDLIKVGDLVESKMAPCPYKGTNVQYWQSVENSLIIAEDLKISFQNIYNYMKNNNLLSISVKDIEKVL